ncbi:hypothetical protein ACT3R7_06560 [Halomonas sp. AOP43-A1-21]
MLPRRAAAAGTLALTTRYMAIETQHRSRSIRARLEPYVEY